MAAGDFIELEAHYNGVYIFLSYLVSFVGAWTTLEMLLKRTGTRGWWNVMLLLGAGIAFGSTATFGMHFVGNQAVTLHFPPPWQGAGVPLSYNAGFTILSLVVSCISMIIAFSFIGLRFDVPRWRSRMADVEQGSLPEKSDDTAYDDEYGTDNLDKKDADFATGAAFDPDVKADSPEDGRQTRFHLPPGRKMSLSSTFDVALPKRHNKVAEEKKRAVEDEDEETEDGGDFGVGGARLSGSGVAKILLAGIVCGGGIAAMHYVGQVSIDSVPLVTNSWYMVFLSVLIAMLCVTVGLYILFVIFRPKLQHSWYKRIIVAGILAVGVTLMHFVALLGTHYWARQGEALKAGSDNTTKMIIIAIICVVAPICCILLLVFAYFGQLRLLRQRASRHRVILSTAIFDQNGLLLVHPESGLLPSSRIYPNKPGEQEKVSLFQLLGDSNRLRLEASKLKLQRSDPAFVAFVKMSWSWRSQRGSAAPGTQGGNSSGDGSQGDRAADEESGPSMRLSEAEEMTGSEAEMLRRSVLSFEMAGEEIASEVTGTPDLKALGVLYDSILKIGHYQVSSKSSGDQFTVTQGQMLVLARRLKNNAEREALVARGFVFAEPGAVARVTANAYAVPYDRVFEYFRDVYRFTRFGIVKRLDRGRLYGGLLMLQALPGEGLNIVVEERQHHSLPMVELATLVDPMADRSRFAASNLAVTTVDSVVNAVRQIGDQSLLELVNTPTATTGYDPSAQLRSLLVGTLRPYLERSLGLDVVNHILPRLHIIPTVVPLTARPGSAYGTDGLAKNAYLVCLKAIIPSSVTLPGAKLNWLPFPLYQAQAECVARASGTDAGSARPNTGGSVVEAARFGGSSSASDKSGGRKGSMAESSESDFPFPTATSAPFVSSAFPSAPSAAAQNHPLAAGLAGGTGKRLSVYSQGSAHEDEEERDSFQPLPQPGASTSEMPRGVPAYSPDWIVGLVRSSVSQPTRTHQWDWDVPSRPRTTPRKSAT
ncbi:MHYT domain signaling protein [Rhodotorula toruloides]|uniref:BY PROTMAP: gi/472586464/gb/EMS23992.1/ MHYT domain signaling protein [Rhodosporidium toruloides NP11] gi/647397447/emb/CDR40447.1/ RHTO0S05e03642g1_1 [Rhodosporidium toruloides] n=1 Tax=Rhodotorula toruloides TaxID=5286 RepID=A0A0K3CK61_RHOTO|nr:MHYT domain signaling protein [Rhodotorula toruloides]PRQ74573.1 hypothetical protein AAT19DRAFT_14926 [Rhodotorula toruloides]